MKTDIHIRINSSKKFVEELVYKLNGDYPDVTFSLEDCSEDVYRINVSDYELHDSDELWEYIDQFTDKFPCEGLYFKYKP